MDLRQLSYVVAVVDEGSFTRAAAAVHVAQPSLSQAVRALEAELGVELFHRTPRRVTLTAAGEALLEPARQALRDADTARAAVARVAGVAAGHLDLVSLPTLAVHPAAEIIGRFRRAHPDVTVRLVEPEDADAVAGRVRNGASELGFAELPLSVPGIETHPLESQQFVAVVPAGLASDLGPGKTLSISRLARLPLITTPRGTSTRRQVDDALASAGFEADIAVETDHREAIGPLVHAGAGVAIVPRALAATIDTGGVAVREVVPRIDRQVGLIHRAGPLSPAAHRFRALAVGAAPGRAHPRPRRRPPRR